MPLIAVLANPKGVLVPLDAEHVVHAMFGNPAYQVKIDAGGGSPPEPGRLIANRDGAVTDKHRYLSAVVTIHRRQVAADWREELSASFPADGTGFGAAADAANRYLRALNQAEQEGAVPEGEYLWAEVYELERPEAEPLPQHLFDGPRDIRYRLDADGMYGPAPPRSFRAGFLRRLSRRVNLA